MSNPPPSYALSSQDRRLEPKPAEGATYLNIIVHRPECIDFAQTHPAQSPGLSVLAGPPTQLAAAPGGLRVWKLALEIDDDLEELQKIIGRACCLNARIKANSEEISNVEGTWKTSGRNDLIETFGPVIALVRERAPSVAVHYVDTNSAAV